MVVQIEFKSEILRGLAKLVSTQEIQVSTNFKPGYGNLVVSSNSSEKLEPKINNVVGDPNMITTEFPSSINSGESYLFALYRFDVPSRSNHDTEKLPYQFLTEFKRLNYLNTLIGFDGMLYLYEKHQDLFHKPEMAFLWTSVMGGNSPKCITVVKNQRIGETPGTINFLRTTQIMKGNHILLAQQILN